MTALITLGVDTDVLSAALDAGTAVGLILIYFWYFLFFFRYLVSRMLIFFFFFKTSLQYPLNGNLGINTIQQWWGNQVFKNTLDWKSTPLRQLEQGATFG